MNYDVRAFQPIVQAQISKGVKMQRFILYILTSVLFIVCFSVVSAQYTESGLRGIIIDSDNNIVSGASVKIRNESTGWNREVVTRQEGIFSAAGLAPGLYTIEVSASGFKTYRQESTKLNAGTTADIKIKLEVGDVQEAMTVSSGGGVVQTSTEARVSDTFQNREVLSMPLPQRDVFMLPKLSAGATAIPGAASSTKLTNSPVITVNGNRYRGNNYVLDGAINTNPNNTGEPTLVPALDSLEEVQVQTSNFSTEYGRGNGAVINLRTKSGTNRIHGKLWEYHRNAALNARNFFSDNVPPLVFNQFGANIGGPVKKDKSFYFGSYEGTRNAVGRPVTFLVETPQIRNYVVNNLPNSVAAQLYKNFPASTPQEVKECGTTGQTCLSTSQGSIPMIGTASVIVSDYIRFDQYLGRFDHSMNDGADKFSVRVITEKQRDNGGTSSSKSTLAKAMRGSRGPYDGSFSNLNLGYIHIFGNAVNDARFSFQNISTSRGNPDAIVPDISIQGLEAGFGDSFISGTKLRTYEIRDALTLPKGRHNFRMGGEYRRVFKGLSLGSASVGSFSFDSITDFIRDNTARQTLTVNPVTGEPTNTPRYFTLFESGFFLQDDYKVTQNFNLNIGVRHDYFGDAKEREGRLSSIILGEGNSFFEKLANAKLGRVDRLYTPEKKNFAPRIGIAYDPFGDGKSSIRTGFSLAYQPHHGQSISGARALPPDAMQGVIHPKNKIGTKILYDIPVPFNPEFARGLNEKGGVISKPGEPPIRLTGFVVNPDIKTQYSMNWFLNIQRELVSGWIAEVGYTRTKGVNLERIDDVNRFSGDLLDGVENRINPNFTSLLFVTNGVTSIYDAMTVELRKGFSRGLSFQTNYRWSKWLDTSSDTSTGQFQDNSEPGKGAQDITCLKCEYARSLFDIPHRFSAMANWMPSFLSDHKGPLSAVFRNWQIASILTAQSGRPFSVWNGATTSKGGDYNMDGGGGAVGGGFYDRPNAPVPGTVKSSFDKNDYLNGLFTAGLFSAPVRGQNGTLGRNTFRGFRYITVDMSLSRTVNWGEKQFQVRFDAFNLLNQVNLYLPVADMSLPNFGKSTQAFDSRTIQIGVKFSL